MNALLTHWLASVAPTFFAILKALSSRSKHDVEEKKETISNENTAWSVFSLE